MVTARAAVRNKVRARGMFWVRNRVRARARARARARVVFGVRAWFYFKFNFLVIYFVPSAFLLT